MFLVFALDPIKYLHRLGDKRGIYDRYKRDGRIEQHISGIPKDQLCHWHYNWAL